MNGREILSRVFNFRKKTKSWSGNRYNDVFERLNSELQQFYNPNSIRDGSEAYRRVSAVYACVQVISRAVAACPMVLLDESENVLQSKGWDDWSREPFPGMSQYQWVSRVVGQMLMTGGCRLVQVFPDRTDLLLPVNLNLCRPKDTNDYPVKTYVYNGEDLPAERVVEILLPDPTQYLDSFSPVEVSASGWQTAYAGMLHLRNMLEKGAFIPQLVRDRNISATPEEYQRKLAVLKQLYSGASQSGSLALVEGDIDILKFGYSLVDLAITEVLGKTKEEIMMAMGVPPALLADSESRYANYREQIRIFYEWTLSPIWRMIEAALNRRFVKQFAPSGWVWFDSRESWIVKELMQTEMATLDTAVKSGILTINEARQRLSLPPVEYGDRWWIPISLVPVESGNSESQQPGKSFDLAVKALASLVKGREKRGSSSRWVTPEVRGIIWRNFSRNLASFERRYAKEMSGWLTDIRDEIVRSVKRSEGKSAEYDRQKAIEKGASKRLSILMAAFRFGAETGQDEVNFGKSLSRKDYEFTTEVMNILKQRARHWAQLTENEIFLEVQDVLGQAVREGLTVQQIIDALKESSVFSDARAERIARTEVIGSLNEGKLAGYKGTGLVRMKEWLATQDDRTRDAHLDADGEVGPLTSLSRKQVNC